MAKSKKTTSDKKSTVKKKELEKEYGSIKKAKAKGWKKKPYSNDEYIQS